MKTDVLIVGAGPTGLMLACQCARFGLDLVVIEKRPAVTTHSKAIGVHARTLEIYDQLGLAGKAIERGAVSGKVQLLAGGQVRGAFDLSRIGEGLSPFPFILNLEQSKNERLLHEYLQSHGKDVLWQSELQNFSQDESDVTAQIKSADGVLQTIEAKYLVGCDGAKSPVRHTLGLPFEGSTFERTFYVADVQIDWELAHDTSHFCLAPDSFLLFFPLKGDNRYRIVGVFPDEHSQDEGEALFKEIEARIKAEAQLPLDIHDVEWFSTYKVHSRHVARFSKGRCFLAGDAAHVHTPAGAQGMNTGIGDAYNLAWKIAAVVQQNAATTLLETYNEERLENAKNLLNTTDRLFHLGAGDEWYLAFLRTKVVPPLASHILGLDVVRKAVFPRISQIGINYRHSSLSNHAGDENFAVKAGDRMPYFQIEGASVYNHLRAPRFHHLLFTDAPNTPHIEYSMSCDCHVFPLSPRVREVFGSEQPFQLLLRPDNHIALLSRDVSPQRVQTYFEKLGE